MKLRLILIFTLYLWGAACSAFANNEAPPIKGNFAAEKISEHVYVIHGPSGLPNPQNQGFMNNPGFIVTSDGVVVVDPGSSVQVGRLVVGAVKQITDAPIIASIATHIHGDHWLGNQAVREVFPDAKFYGHPDLITRANNGEALNWLDLMHQLTEGATAGTIPVIPKIEVDGGDTLVFGDINISIHHNGKAHTTNDIALFVEQDRVLFTGDLVFNRRLGRMDDGSFVGLSNSLAELIALAPEVVVPGHGITGDIDLIADHKQLHDMIYKIIEEQFEEGLTDFEIKPLVMEQLTAFSHWEGFESGIGRVVSIGYLEVEENAF